MAKRKWSQKKKHRPPRPSPLWVQLSAAAESGDVDSLSAALAAGGDPNAVPPPGYDPPLFAAASSAQPACVVALLHAGACPAAANSAGLLALHAAAIAGCERSVAALLHAGAAPAAASAKTAWTAVHYAAFFGHTATLRLLLKADPAAALAEGLGGELPVQLALRNWLEEPARILLEEGPAMPLDTLLALAGKHPHGPSWLLSRLIAAVAARQPLTAAEWDRVPSPCRGLAAALPSVLARSTAEATLLLQHLEAAEHARLRPAVVAASGSMTDGQWALLPTPCPGLGMALPAVLERSTAEAALLVCHLPADDRERLHAFAMCLARLQRRWRRRMRPLPTPLIWRLLALAAAA
ncbi:hypothetical protein ABPG75_009243 [Micractinium tetrahymenae]